MARISVTHGIDDLANDLAAIPINVTREAGKAVQKNIKQGAAQARLFARESAGIHGKNYFKRITPERTGPLQGEWGPEGVVAGNAVGGGWRNGPPNTDLPKSADIQGPKFANDIGDILDKAFWP